MLQESNTYDWHYGDRAEIGQMNKMQDMFVVTDTHTHTHTLRHPGHGGFTVQNQDIMGSLTV